MSTVVTRWVNEHSQAKHGTRYVLNVIADHANSDGVAIMLSQKRIARYANLTVRQVRRAIDDLVKLGELQNEVGMGGTPGYRWDRCPNRYTVLKHSGPCNNHGPDKTCSKLDERTLTSPRDDPNEGVPTSSRDEAHGRTYSTSRADISDFTGGHGCPTSQSLSQHQSLFCPTRLRNHLHRLRASRRKRADLLRRKSPCHPTSQ